MIAPDRPERAARSASSRLKRGERRVAKSAAFMRGAVTALLCCMVAFAGMRLVLSDHYSLVVRNVGSAPVAANVLMPSGVRMQRRILPGDELCVAARIKKEGRIQVRVGAYGDSVYVGQDLGRDVTVEVTTTSVQFLRPVDRILPWRACWQAR
jgi:hypothetical protein